MSPWFRRRHRHARADCARLVEVLDTLGFYADHDAPTASRLEQEAVEEAFPFAGDGLARLHLLADAEDPMGEGPPHSRPRSRGKRDPRTGPNSPAPAEASRAWSSSMRRSWTRSARAASSDLATFPIARAIRYPTGSRGSRDRPPRPGPHAQSTAYTTRKPTPSRGCQPGTGSASVRRARPRAVR